MQARRRVNDQLGVLGMGAGNKRKSKVLYGISRIDDPVYRTHAWRVSLRRHGKALVRNFTDKKWGGKQKAQQAAKQFRDRLVKQHAPMLRVEFATILRKNNRSGVSGVCRVVTRYKLADNSERSLLYWEAIWPTTPGSHANQRFSVAIYGEARAFEMACEARRKGLRKVTGVYWAAERGE